mgnify:CR=1
QSIPYLWYDGMASWHIVGVHKCGVPRIEFVELLLNVVLIIITVGAVQISSPEDAVLSAKWLFTHPYHLQYCFAYKMQHFSHSNEEHCLKHVQYL